MSIGTRSEDALEQRKGSGVNQPIRERKDESERIASKRIRASDNEPSSNCESVAMADSINFIKKCFLPAIYEADRLL